MTKPRVIGCNIIILILGMSTYIRHIFFYFFLSLGCIYIGFFEIKIFFFKSEQKYTVIQKPVKS